MKMNSQSPEVKWSVASATSLVEPGSGRINAMMSNLTKYLALAAAVMMTATVGAGCSTKKEASTGAAKVGVQLAVVADVTKVELTITGAPGEAGFPIVTELSKAASGKTFTGSITGIPATGGTGQDRTFTAAAYNGATKIFEGSAVAKVIGGAPTPTQVTIILQELNVTPGPTNYAPVITSLTSTAAYLLPGQTGSFTVSASDPDHNGDPLGYAWAATCTGGGVLTLPTPATATTVAFTAPAVSSVCTVSITVKEASTAGNHSSPLSVTTYFTLTVNADFGKADVIAIPNSYPIVTVAGDFRYNYFADVLTIPVGQQGDLRFSATDPDGDDVKFDLTAQCGTFNAALVLQGATPATQLSAITFTGPTGSAFNPTFGYPQPAVAAFSDPAKDCQFTVVVHDLCTAGNCGAAGTNGQPKSTTIAGATVVSSTTGIINATHPAQPQRAPVIVRVGAPNQLGPNATGVQTWDPQKIAIVEPAVTYHLTAEAEDKYEAGPLSAAWVCNTGNAPLPATDTLTNGGKSLKSELAWTPPSTLVVGMFCTVTFTSAASHLATVASFQFAGSDPCVGQPGGTACSTGNLCVTGETCTAGVCGGGTAQHRDTVGGPVIAGACTSSDQCHTAGTCATATGVCSNPAQPNNTACNADSNGCTANDSCQAGVCTAGAAPVCNTPPNSYCFAAAGACVDAGTAANNFNASTCAYTAQTAQACTVANAAVKCSGASTFASFACDASGACVGAGPTACTTTQCSTGGSCGAATGTCVGGAPQPTTTVCNDGNACTTADHCDGAGACTGTPCAAGQSCAPATGCLSTTIVPEVVWDLQLSPPAAIAMDVSGNTFAAGNIFTNTDVDFRLGRYPAVAGAPLLAKSAGGIDGFLAKYDAAGNILWTTTIADDDTVSFTNDQTATGTAVTSSSLVSVIGKVVGTVTFGATSTAAAAPLPYLAAFDASGAAPVRAWIHAYNLGSNGLFNAVASNPNQASNRIAVCGLASAAATQLVTGATFGGATDLIVAVFDSAGTKLWAKQLGGTGNESCTAVTVDDNGDVVATGQFDGASLAFDATTLTGPGTTARKFQWVTRFAGATGVVQSAVAYNGTLGQVYPRGIAVAPNGDVVIGGNFSGNVALGATTLTSGGSDDGFVVRLDALTLAPVWAVRVGGSAIDLVKGVSVTSFGDVVAVGTFNPASATFKAANGGFDTSGAAQLTVSGAAAADIFVLKLNGSTGATDFAAAYGDAGTQNGDAIVVNRFGATPNHIAFTNTISGTYSYGTIGPISAAGGTDAGLVFAHLQ
jgi:hypothetical protein